MHGDAAFPRTGSDPQMPSTAARDTRALVAFVMTEGGLWRSPIYLYVAAASGGRALLIFALNETAARGGATLLGALGILGCILLTLAAGHAMRVKSAELVETLAMRLRRRIAGQVLNADVALMQRRDPGQIYNAVTNQTNAVATATTRLVNLVEALLLLILCLGYMALQSWPAALATLAALGAGIAVYILAEIPARRMVTAANTARAGFYDRINDVIRGYKELRLRRSKRDGLSDHIDRSSTEVRGHGIAASRYFSLGHVGAQAALFTLLAAIVIGLPWVVGADSVLILQVLTVVLFAFGPIDSVVGSLPGLVSASVALRQIREVEADLARNAEPEALRQAPEAHPRFSRIELRGITAELTRPAATGSAARDSFTLGPIDLVLEPGQSVFVTGGNGMGKSTLLQILTGLRHPDKGRILLDGAPVTPEGIGRYRELFAAVFSEFYLFKTLYGMTEAERDRLETHIAELGLAEGVSLKDGAFSSLALSTGQMRRLALSAALAEERAVIVLDEFAADQDPARRAFFYDVLVPRLARAGHLVIAVTHDEPAFGKCDRLIRMADGKIVSDTQLAAGAPDTPDRAASGG